MPTPDADPSLLEAIADTVLHILKEVYIYPVIVGYMTSDIIAGRRINKWRNPLFIDSVIEALDYEPYEDVLAKNSFSAPASLIEAIRDWRAYFVDGEPPAEFYMLAIRSVESARVIGPESWTVKRSTLRHLQASFRRAYLSGPDPIEPGMDLSKLVV